MSIVRVFYMLIFLCCYSIKGRNYLRKIFLRFITSKMMHFAEEISAVEGLLYLYFAELIFAFQVNKLDFVELIFAIFAVLILKFRNIPLKFHKSAKKGLQR